MACTHTHIYTTRFENFTFRNKISWIECMHFLILFTQNGYLNIVLSSNRTSVCSVWSPLVWCLVSVARVCTLRRSPLRGRLWLSYGRLPPHSWLPLHSSQSKGCCFSIRTSSEPYVLAPGAEEMEDEPIGRPSHAHNTYPNQWGRSQEGVVMHNAYSTMICTVTAEYIYRQVTHHRQLKAHVTNTHVQCIQA